MDASETSTFVSADGEGYELQMGRWSRRLAPLLIDFAGFSSAGRVLDVGCGTGNLSFALAKIQRSAGSAGSIVPQSMSTMQNAAILTLG